MKSSFDLSKGVAVADTLIEEWLKATPARGKSSLVEAFDYPELGSYDFLRGFCEGNGIHVAPELWEWKKEREDEYETVPF